MADLSIGLEPKVHGKSEVEWAWEFHKNCDQLLHQRLASFTAAQAMTLAAFMVLTNARFQPGLDERVVFIEFGRYLIDFFGLALSGFTWMVTYPMVKRLDYLNENILFEEIPMYKTYHQKALEDFKIPGWRWIDRALVRFGAPEHERTPRRFYRNIIPRYLPISEMALWSMLGGLMLLADIYSTTKYFLQ